jgi:hypothetical protein
LSLGPQPQPFIASSAPIHCPQHHRVFVSAVPSSKTTSAHYPPFRSHPRLPVLQSAPYLLHCIASATRPTPGVCATVGYQGPASRWWSGAGPSSEWSIFHTRTCASCSTVSPVLTQQGAIAAPSSWRLCGGPGSQEATLFPRRLGTALVMLPLLQISGKFWTFCE